jgi:hypothetical protein
MVYALPGLKEEGAIRLPAFEVPLDYSWVSNTRLVDFARRGTRIARKAGIDRRTAGHRHRWQEAGIPARLPHVQASSRGNSRYPATIRHTATSRTYRRAPTTATSRDLAPVGMGPHSLLYDIDSRNAVRKLMADLPNPDLGFLIQHDGKPRLPTARRSNYAAAVPPSDEDRRLGQAADGHGRRYTLLGFSRRRHPVRRAVLEVGRAGIAGAGKTSQDGERVTLFSRTPSPSPPACCTAPGRTALRRPRQHRQSRSAVYFDDKNEDARLHKLLSHNSRAAGSWLPQFQRGRQAAAVRGPATAIRAPSTCSTRPRARPTCCSRRWKRSIPSRWRRAARSASRRATAWCCTAS